MEVELKMRINRSGNKFLTISVFALLFVIVLAYSANAQYCPTDMVKCPDGSMLARDPNNNCEPLCKDPNSCFILQMIFTQSYGSNCQSGKYNPISDFNNDGKIDLSDLVLFGQNSRDNEWCGIQLNKATNPCYSGNNDCLKLQIHFFQSYGSNCLTSNKIYLPFVDFNKDGSVDLVDFMTLSQNINNNDWCKAQYYSNTSGCFNNGSVGSNCFQLQIRLATSYNSICGDSNYNIYGDVDNDRKVALSDFILFAKNIYNEGWCNNELENSYNPCGTKIPTCSDKDNGINIYTKSYAVGDNGAYYPDQCEGTNTVKEAHCELQSTGGSKPVYTLLSCPYNYTCSDGACVKVPTPTPTPTVKINPDCYDSDGGLNYYTLGTVTSNKNGGQTKTDRCYSSNYLMEYFCSSSGSVSARYIQCNCVNGVCMRASPLGLVTGEYYYDYEENNKGFFGNLINRIGVFFS